MARRVRHLQVAVLLTADVATTVDGIPTHLLRPLSERDSVALLADRLPEPPAAAGRGHARHDRRRQPAGAGGPRRGAQPGAVAGRGAAAGRAPRPTARWATPTGSGWTGCPRTPAGCCCSPPSTSRTSRRRSPPPPRPPEWRSRPSPRRRSPAWSASSPAVSRSPNRWPARWSRPARRPRSGERRTGCSPACSTRRGGRLRRAMHLAAATTGTDADLADELERAAAGGQGGWVTASGGAVPGRRTQRPPERRGRPPADRRPVRVDRRPTRSGPAAARPPPSRLRGPGRHRPR